ncbi:polynucleotide adenylyltransferase PcnB [Panacagrimonas sp.]|uniref:polynucleotide adenylyltransferase PcnB n=1 Tax=Panacagrimonas sp. TaxID=2480088 RepID=UPI003B524AC5
MISPGTLKTLYTLKEAGYEAYMVGGGVRDLLAGITPKDFDVATNAHPEQVKKLFRACRLVGRRFVICHVRFGQEVLEVTTFRGAITDMHQRDETGRVLVDNDYGTLEEDAFRRDFTVNALYYDIRDFSIVDYCGGLEDLKAGTLRLIGDPELRYREDPVRMLRAIRIANKLHFRLDPATAAPIGRLSALLAEIPAARLFDEVLKVLLCREGVDNLYGLRVYGLFRHLFPATEALLGEAAQLAFLNDALRNSAERIEQDLPVSPAFLYAALLWAPTERRARQLQDKEGHPEHLAMEQAGEEVIARACARVAIPKRFALPMREIWSMQARLTQRSPARARRLMTHPRFRAAYDFLLLRARNGDPALMELADWWTRAQADRELPPLPSSAADQSEGPDAATDEARAADEPGKRRRRRRRGGRRTGGEAAPAG